MSLSSIFTELHRNAARTGQDRAQELRGGARLAVRVQAGVVTLTISRAVKKLSSTEIEVFKRDCGVPPTAVRYPAEGQGTKQFADAPHHFVAFRWREDGSG